MKAVESYSNHKVATKNTDGGGKEVREFCGEQTHAVLCGVNYGACVFHTANELKKEMNVLVVRNACNQPSWWSWSMDDYTKKYTEEIGKDCVVQHA